MCWSGPGPFLLCGDGVPPMASGTRASAAREIPDAGDVLIVRHCGVVSRALNSNGMRGVTVLLARPASARHQHGWHRHAPLVAVPVVGTAFVRFTGAGVPSVWKSSQGAGGVPAAGW